MKYICLGYMEPGKCEGMTEDEQHAMFDECFEYNDRLRANGHAMTTKKEMISQGLGAVPKAAAQPDKYSQMASVDQYWMERNADILSGGFQFTAHDRHWN